jgi:N6-L-threonylcarbamoyladenine synthase
MLLAFETSCDETSAAVVHRGRVLSNVVSSQVQLHAEYGGVVPELAAREHLRNLTPLAREALNQAAAQPEQLDAVAATQGPGLPGALLVGLKAAQALAFVLRRRFIGVHHHEAHLYSPWIIRQPSLPATKSSTPSPLCSTADEPPGRDEFHLAPNSSVNQILHADFSHFETNVSLIVSGGHTLLVHVLSETTHRVLGGTVDDAAGECFDKTGKLLGLPYPAGPEIDRLAARGNPKAFDFPRPMLNDPGDDFSFSGLKTSVRYFLRDRPQLASDPAQLADLCASIQSAIVDVLVAKTIKAALRLRVNCITASGGVTCNRALRAQLSAACAKRNLSLRLADHSLCTDNAAMIGLLAEKRLAESKQEDLDSDIRPGWVLGTQPLTSKQGAA